VSLDGTTVMLQDRLLLCKKGSVVRIQRVGRDVINKTGNSTLQDEFDKTEI
jgi:hypothetical protein